MCGCSLEKRTRPPAFGATRGSVRREPRTGVRNSLHFGFLFSFGLIPNSLIYIRLLNIKTEFNCGSTKNQKFGLFGFGIGLGLGFGSGFCPGFCLGLGVGSGLHGSGSVCGIGLGIGSGLGFGFGSRSANFSTAARPRPAADAWWKVDAATTPMRSTARRRCLAIAAYFLCLQLVLHLLCFVCVCCVRTEGTYCVVL